MHMTIAQMAVTALLVALLPLSLVWTSSDANKYRKLVWVSVFLTFDLIVFGAFTRLTDSGLGCPDWPGCYGAANPFLAHQQIVAAEALITDAGADLSELRARVQHLADAHTLYPSVGNLS